MKKVVKLNETDLRKMINEAVKRVLKEGDGDWFKATIPGWELVENTVWDYFKNEDDVEDFVKNQNDPALSEVYDKEYEIWAQWDGKDIIPSEDQELEEMINKVRNPKLRKALLKTYYDRVNYMLGHIDDYDGFYNHTAAEREYWETEMAEPDYNM